ncbi:hypothetical protein ACKKBG_A13265 [Auxenochlorella protothecoides x Auxenochlorella symbiontica]
MASALPPRKPDPNRFKSVVSMPEDAVKDPDYLRAVQDLEDQQSNRAGWLFAKGAFDKGDLLHLRDEEERGRHLEKEVRDAEQREFARQRAELERRAESGQGAGAAPSAGGAGAAPSKRPPGAEIPSGRQKRMVPLVRIKPLRPEAAVPAVAHESTREAHESAQEPSAEARGEAGSEGEGLAGLLGQYGSDSDGEGEAASS